MTVPSNAVAWRAWSHEAFGRAAAEHKPVLLFLTVPWCQWCDEMDRTTFSDPAVACLSNELFVPIRVDAARRPEVADRYSLGGWPTTAFLTPAGELLGGGTFLRPDRLREVLAQVADAFAARQEDFSTPPLPPTPPTLPTPLTLDESAADWIRERALAEHDDSHGGFGLAPKVPRPAALLLVVDRAVEGGDERLRRIAIASLDAMSEGGLFDPVEGGFFRYCTGRDWSGPMTEKLLEVNAMLARVYLRAWRAWSIERYRATVVAVLRYVNETLIDRVDGGFFASQRGDDAYYALGEHADRKSRGAPPVDHTLFADANAMMIRTYLEAGELLGDSSLVEFAVQSLERVLLATYRRGVGVAHWAGDEAIDGLLNDQVEMAAALLDACAATDRSVYLDLAQELMLTAARRLWDHACSGFFDCPPGGIGRLRVPTRPLGPNCEAASVLATLAARTGQAELGGKARAILAAFAGRYRDAGLDGAPYALAVRAVLNQTSSA